MVKKLLFCIVFIMDIGFMLQAQNSDFVGAIPGSIDVSPMGAATYTIPIEVVPGTQGMQPNLSIVYNSMGGMGLLGMKWDLTGLSAITRCGKTPYFDAGEISTINFNGFDFALDGSRLVNVGTCYATQEENFMRIYRLSINGNIYFDAYTDDGSVIQYGFTTDSRQVVGNKVLSWRVNKITDANGNTMTFEYYEYYPGEIVINSISYTGNTNNNMQPYASVYFEYGDIPYNMGRNTCFIAGYAVPQVKLLESITVNYEGNIVRKYQFYYNKNEPEKRHIHLLEVRLYDAENRGLLSRTTINWGDQSSAIQSFPKEKLPGFVNAHGVNNGGYLLACDFNGDGYTDYVLYGKGGSRDRWERYSYNYVEEKFYKYGETLSHKGLDPDETGCYFFAADIYGTGRDAIIIAEQLADKTTYSFNIGPGGIKIPDFHQLFFGDFDGDGTTDILFMSKNNRSGQIECTFKLLLSGNLDNNISFAQLSGNLKIRIGDFDGKGKADVEVHSQDGDINTFFLNASKKFQKYSINPQPTGSFTHTSRYSGDFNGDGITDLLVYSANDYSWKVSFGKGDGTYTANPTTLSNLNGEYVVSGNDHVPKYKVTIADFNGDGKEDIVQFLNGSAIAIYSNGYTNNQYQYKCENLNLIQDGSSISKMSVADFNNDGLLDIIVQSSNTNPPTINLINIGRKYDCVNKITDGLGKEIDFSYEPKYFQANDFNESRSVRRKSFKFLVSKLKISDGINNIYHTFTYTFDIPIFSWKKRTFLGFFNFYCTNIEEDRTDDMQFSMDSEDIFTSKHILVPNAQRSSFNSLKFSPIINYTVKLMGGLFHPLHYIPYYKTNNWDKITDISTETADSLNNEGRLGGRRIKTFDELDPFSKEEQPKKAFLLEEHLYTHLPITLTYYQKKTVLTKIITTQKYNNSSVLLTDTLEYNYCQTGTNKGRLLWQRRSNIDGCITTSYDNYYPTGVYGTKTVSAAGYAPRTETYTYDTTNRFVTSVTNPLNHTTTFTYYPETGNKKSETDPNGLTTTYYYDPFGNLTKINYPNGLSTTITTNWYSSPFIPNAKYSITTKTQGTPDLIVYYDVFGREVCRKEDTYYYDTRYNVKGEVEKTSLPFTPLNKQDENKIWNEYTYDEYGRILTEKSPYTHLSYDYHHNHTSGSRTITVFDSLRKISSEKEYDALKRIIEARDTGGILSFNYHITNNKKHKTIINFSKTTSGSSPKSTTTILSDLWGNRLSIDEPNAGMITNTYNKFNELIVTFDDNNNNILYQYDLLGRVTKKEFHSEGEAQIYETNYIYDISANGKGKLHKIHSDFDYSEEEVFTYDHLSRLVEHKKMHIHGTFIHSYTYNNLGQIQTITYPSNFKIAYTYYSNGKIYEIRNTNNSNSLIYRVHSRNEFGAVRVCEYGNGLATINSFNSYGLSTHIKTGNILAPGYGEEPNVKSGIGDEASIPFDVDGSTLNYNFDYNNVGLMTSRSESVAKCTEVYTYDILDRLTGITPQSNKKQILTYHENGNILSNSKVGTYTYDSNKPNAVTKITLTNPSSISSNNCAVSYNFFNQPSLITEGDYELEIFYGADRQRNIVFRYKKDNNNNFQSDVWRYLVSKYYEKEILFTPSISHLHYHYIYGDAGAVALYISTPNTDNNNMYYIHTDHLGSYCAITNAAKQVRQRNWEKLTTNHLITI